MEQTDPIRQYAPKNASPRLTRRAVLARLLEVGTLVAFLSEAGASPAPYVDAGPVTAFRRGTLTRVVLPAAYDQEVVYVSAPEKAPLIAFSARCTHSGCVVAWDDAQRTFLCPCHGGQFDRTGNNIAGPPPRPLHRLKTHRLHGRLLIEAPPRTSSSGD